jgi:hypothetical protein
VANINLEKSSRVEQAQGRLDKAVARLEKALVQRREGGTALSKQLAAAEAENESLRELNAQVARRLDATIDRLKAVLKD